ncbi:hypothetical protein OIU79_025243 [Salix purpurea]|uniref:Uncharacterized protein n=1 Tax=Salix purpurea TaxID=77065 RepID=A0A9Q1A6R5_SALPP|nr:hypothetical protein OIU79_025243 [Salix purpurea]
MGKHVKSPDVAIFPFGYNSSEKLGKRLFFKTFAVEIQVWNRSPQVFPSFGQDRSLDRLINLKETKDFVNYVVW